MRSTEWTKLKIYKQLIKKYIVTFINLMLTNIMDITIVLLFPMFIKTMVDVSFYNRNFDLFYKIMIGIVILFVCRLFIFFIMDLSWNFLCMHFRYFVAQMVYKKVMRMKPQYFMSISMGDIIERINYDTSNFWDLFYWSGVYLIIPLFYVVITMGILILLDFKIAVVLIIVTLLSVIMSHLLSDKLKKLQKLYVDKNAKFIGWIYDLLHGIKDIVLFSAQGFMSVKFVRKSVELIRERIKLSKKEFVFSRMNTTISFVSTMTTYIICALGIFNGDITLGAFIAITQYVGVVNKNFADLVNYILSYKKNNVVIDRVLNILNDDSDYGDDTGIPFPAEVQTIQFNNIYFSYGNGTKVLENFNLTIQRGTKIAVVGKSGIGKSTLLNLLLQFYEPDSGEILIDGIDIKQFSLESLRDNIGIIFQEPYLFEDTLKYNIENSRYMSSNEDLSRVLEQADIDKFVENLPEKLESKIGANGIKLSRGQMQRIVIARILNKNPQIILMDEATASLDKESETQILDIINSISCDRIIISVTHQTETMKNADIVAVINDGKVTAYAPFEELKDNINLKNIVS